MALSRQLVSAIQAEVLLARYFFNLGRLLEGRFHANAAVSLAISCGMHRIAFGAQPPPTSSATGARSVIGGLTAASSSSGMFDLAPARDPVELGERVRLFWEVYTLDRCWSVALGSPCVLTDDEESGTQIDTPWPKEMEEYDQVLQQLTSLTACPNLIAFQLTAGSAATTFASQGRTVQGLLESDPAAMQQYSQGSSLALRGIASTFYGRSARLSATLRNGERDLIRHS